MLIVVHRARDSPAPYIGGYEEYASFSKFVTTQEIDDIVMKAAEELGHQAALSIAALQNQIAEGAW